MFGVVIVDNDLVEAIAADAGIITVKDDGNDDDHCSWSGDWNGITIQHSDGSSAIYGHMKKNSLTTKPIGTAVAKGEYLGVVASSGFSDAPHLHFETYDGNGQLIAPYQGTCNLLNSQSYWSAQPTSIEHPEEEEQITIQPNPVTSEFVVLGLKNNSSTVLRIIDLHGRTILQSNDLNSAINLSDYSAGIYFITIKTEEQFYTRKIIKQ